MEQPAVPGLTPPSSRARRPDFLSDVVVAFGFASRETVEQAVREARAGTTVARVLVESGAITEDQLARATAERYGLDHLDLYGFAVDGAAVGTLPPAVARRHMAVPVGFTPDGSLIVAIADPTDGLALSEIATITERRVMAAVAARDAIEALVEQLQPSDADVQRPQPRLIAVPRLEAEAPDVVGTEPDDLAALRAELERLHDELERATRRVAEILRATNAAGSSGRAARTP